MLNTCLLCKDLMILKKESNAYIILILKSYQSLKLFKQECGFYYIKDGTVKVCNTFKMQVDINLYYLLSKNYKKNKCYYFFIWSSGNWTQGLMQVLYPELSSQLVSLWTCNSSFEKPHSPLSLFYQKSHQTHDKLRCWFQNQTPLNPINNILSCMWTMAVDFPEVRDQIFKSSTE